MARSVNIAFNFMTADAVNDVDKLNKVLKEMNKEVKKVEKPIKIDVISAEAEKRLQSLENRLSSFNSKAKYAYNGMNGLGEAIIGGLVGSKANQMINSFVEDFMSLENAIYSLKVVAGSQAPPIEVLRNNMLELASTSSFTAVEMSKALDSVMRMGLSYADAMNIVSASSDLALASGENIGDAVNIMNKLIVSLKVNSADAERVTQSLHATAVSTATDLAGLGSSAKQWAGAMSTLSSTTTKSGKDLNEYRLQLVEIGNGLSGILANMGRAPEQQGTTVREFLTKMVKADKSAEEMLDANLKRNRVRVDEHMKLISTGVSGGAEVTSKSISNLMKQDASQAINLMSNLVKNNLVDLETMIKVFNGRYGLIVSSMLRQIDGDVGRYNARLSEMVKLTEDASLQAENLNMKWSKTKNLFAESTGFIQSAFKGFASNSLDAIISFFEAMPNWAKNLGSVALATVVLTTAIVGVGLVLAPILPLIGAFVGANALLLGSISLITAGVITLFGISEKSDSIKKSLDEQSISIMKMSMDLDMANKSLKNYKDTLDAINLTSYSSAYESISNVLISMESPIDSVMTKLKDTKDIMNETMSAFARDPKLIEEKNKAIEKLGDSLKTLNSISRGQFNKNIVDLNEKEIRTVLEMGQDATKQSSGRYKETKTNLLAYLDSVKKLKIEEIDYYNKTIELEDKKRQAVSQVLSTLDNEIISKVQDSIANSSKKTVNGIIGDVSSQGSVAKKYMDDIVNSSKKLGIQLTTNKLKNKEFVSSLADATKLLQEQEDWATKLNIALTETAIATTEYGMVAGQASLLAVSEEDYKKTAYMLEIMDKLEERKKQLNAELNKKDKSTKSKDTTNMFQLANLTNKYEASLLKTINLNQSELILLMEKRKEMDAIFEIQKKTELKSISNKAKSFGYRLDGVDDKNLKESMNYLKSQMVSYEKTYAGSKVKSEIQDQYNNWKELYDIINEYFAFKKENENSSTENTYQQNQTIKEQMIYLREATISLQEFNSKQQEQVLANRLEILKLTSSELEFRVSEINITKQQIDIEQKLYEAKKLSMLAGIGKGLTTTPIDTIESVKSSYEEYLKLMSNKDPKIASLNKDEIARFEKIKALLDLIGENELKKLSDSTNLAQKYLDKIEVELTLKQKSLDYDNKRIESEEYVQKLLSKSNVVDDAKRELNIRTKIYDDTVNFYNLQKEALLSSASISQDIKNIEMSAIDNKLNLLIKEYEFEIKLGNLKLQNAKELRTYEESTKQYQVGFSMLESISKGEGIKFDFTSLRDKAIQGLVGKTSFGKEMKGADYANLSGYAVGILNNFMQTAMAGKTKELEYESKILELRMQGATTEEEKLEISKQQLQLQKDMIDAQMRQQTGFLGVSGGAGGALSGAFGGAMMGGSAGGVWGAVAGGLIGGISGLMGGRQAEKDAERQKELLEQQQKMTEYLSTIAKLTETSNHFMSQMAAQGSKYGMYTTKKMLDMEMASNPNKFKIGGSAVKSWINRWTTGHGWGKEEHAEQRNLYGKYDLSSFGIGSVGELSNEAKLTQLQKQITDEKAKQAEAMRVANRDRNTWWEESYAQAEANLEALKQMENSLESSVGIMKKMKESVYQSYFGATLKETLGEDGKTITGYYADYTEAIGTILSSSFDSLSSNILSNGNSVTKMLFDGLNNVFIKESSKMSILAENITEIFKGISTKISQGGQISSAEMKTMIDATEALKNEQTEVTKQAENYINLWLSSGGKMSDITSSMTKGMADLYGSMKTALSSGDLANFGSSIGTTIIDSMTTKILDSKFTETFKNLYASISNAVQNTTLSSLGSVYSQIQSAGIRMEAEQSRLNAIKSLFEQGNVEYTQDSSKIEYVSGSSKQNIFNNYATINIDGGYIFTDNENSLSEFGNTIANYVGDALKNYKS